MDQPPLKEDKPSGLKPIGEPIKAAEETIKAAEKPPVVNQPLSEKDFIQNGWKWTSLPFWLWLFLLSSILLLILGTQGWYKGFILKEEKSEPFLEVTNREFSLFLWQFPNFMRVNTRGGMGYLSGFYVDRENFNPAKAEEFVSAPPELIFLYHTWSRLLRPESITRPISPEEFQTFLEKIPEWEPENWKKAPVDYVQLVNSKHYLEIKDLQTLPLPTLPLDVRLAFQGWKNYFYEGSEINQINPTFSEVEKFLVEYPHYSRNYWRNIEYVHGHKVAGPEYLKTLLNKGSIVPEEKFPAEELAPFLKMALFNAEQTRRGR